MQSKGGYEYSCNVSATEPEGVTLTNQSKDNGIHDNHESNQSENTHGTEVKQQGEQEEQVAETQGTKENEIHVTLTGENNEESSRTS